MYNSMRRCLIISMKFHRKFLTQSVHENNLSRMIDRQTNIRLNKQFYCQATTEKEDDRVNIGVRNNFLQQKLDEFLADPENKKIFEILKLEINVMRHNAEKVPEELTPKDWLTLVKTKTKTQRKKYLKFLWLNEISSKNKKAKKELKKIELLAKKAEQIEDTGEIKYGLLHNSIFLRIYDTTINRYYNGKLLQAMMFEPKIVFDCDYENYMTPREIHDCAKQLILSFATNRIHTNPMSLYFCNMKENGLLLQYCNVIMPNFLDDDFPATITSQSYLDLFPREQLLYLTPHCKTDLTEYNPDMVYIIGGMVDKHNQQPLSLAKAKKDGIRMAKLPLNKYLPWGSSSSKNLTLNQIINILLDLRHTKDWKKALQHVPTRKLKDSRDHMLQLKVKKTLEKYLKKTKKTETQGSNILDSNFEIQTETQDFTFANRKRQLD